MRKLLIALVGITALWLSSPTLALEGEELLYAELLTKNNSVHIKAAAQSIYNKKIKNEELTDLVAEVLLQSLDGRLILTEDAQAWLAKALGASKNLRYKNILVAIDNSDASSKVRKYASKAEDKLINESNEPYTKGSLDIEELSREILKNKSTYVTVATKDNFRKVGKGDTINDVIAEIGLPDDVNIIYATRKQRWIGRISYSMIKIEYENLGVLSFEYFNEPVDNWTVVNIGILTEFSSELDHHPMLNSSPKEVTSYIRSLMNQNTATKLDFDIAAERLYRDVKDERYTDTLSWACKLLVTSGNSRYIAVLKNTIKKSPTRKLRRYAEGALNKLGEGNDKQYSPGDVYSQSNEKVGD